MLSDAAYAREERKTTGTIVDIACISTLAVLSFYCGNIGFLGSDDAGYIEAARQWVYNVPPVSNFFGDLRYTVILPIAASIMLFGDNETAVAIPAFLYAFGSIIVTYFGMRALSDRATAVIAAALFAISPLLAGLSTTPGGDDVCELFFVLVSLFTFFVAVRNRDRWPLFMLSGIAAGLAFMSRESTLALLCFYGILFLGGFGGRRHVFWIMAAGFAAVFLTEIAYYAIAAGDPFHRIRLVAVAAHIVEPIDAVGGVDLSSGRVFNISPFVDPILYTSAHPQLAFTFPIFFCALAYVLARKTALPGLMRSLFFYWSSLGFLSFLLAAYLVSHMFMMPRYFLLPLYCAIMAIAIWLRFALWSSYKVASVAACLVLVGGSALGTMMANRTPLFPERTLVALVKNSNAVIHTDPNTMFVGRLLYRWDGVVEKISSEPPKAGDFFLYNPKLASLQRPRNAGINLDLYRPGDAWVVEQRISETPSLLARWLSASGADRLLPQAIVHRIVAPNPPIILYRIPG